MRPGGTLLTIPRAGDDLPAASPRGRVRRGTPSIDRRRPLRSSLRLTRTLLAAGVVLSLAAAPAAAGPEPRTHDGFFLRLSTGYGAANADITSGGRTLELSGASGDVNIAIGGVVAGGFALHGTLWGWTINDPDERFTGLPDRTASGSLTLGAIGVGGTYYFSPVNFYVSGSVGTGALNGSGDADGRSRPGFALDGTLGYEWWVGEQWGLGLNGGVSYFSSKDDDIIGIGENWSGPAFALRFSATFN